MCKEIFEDTALVFILAILIGSVVTLVSVAVVAVFA